MWKVTACVGIFWDRYDIPLGVYRWRWLANVRGRAHLVARPWREFRVEPA